MCCCSLKKDVKPDLKEDACQLILKGKILASTFPDRVEVLNYHTFLFTVCTFFNRNSNAKKSSKCTSFTLKKKSCISKPFLHGYYYFTCDLTACVDLYTKSDS